MVKEKDKVKMKANWDPVAAQIFCELCADEVGKGNRPSAYMNDTGYKNVQAGFLEKTGRPYTRKQFKNRWDAMKSVYIAWKHFKGKVTGLGWDDVKKTVTADDQWWKDTIAESNACAGFRKGPPPYVMELEKMFVNAHVDGTSSFMPGVDGEGEEVEEDNEDPEVEEVEQPLGTPVIMVRGPGKRPITGGGPSPKIKKSNMQKDFKRMVDHYTSGKSSAAVDTQSEIEAIMVKVVECGAKEGTEEHYMATKLFGKSENRIFFNTMKTHKGRFIWLTRMYQDRKRN